MRQFQTMGYLGIFCSTGEWPHTQAYFYRTAAGAVSRYIELNLVRAGMVAHPAKYPWSSYQYNALGKPIELITPHFLYQGLAKTDKTNAICRFI